MATWIEDLKQMAQDGGNEATLQWLEDSRQAAPYCVLPALLYLKKNGVKGNEKLLSKLAISFPDRQALALLLSQEADALAAFYPPEAKPETPDTVTTIDRFLDNYGKTSPSEVEAISRAIFNPSLIMPTCWQHRKKKKVEQNSREATHRTNSSTSLSPSRCNWANRQPKRLSPALSERKRKPKLPMMPSMILPKLMTPC